MKGDFRHAIARSCLAPMCVALLAPRAAHNMIHLRFKPDEYALTIPCWHALLSFPYTSSPLCFLVSSPLLVSALLYLTLFQDYRAKHFTYFGWFRITTLCTPGS